MVKMKIMLPGLGSSIHCFRQEPQTWNSLPAQPSPARVTGGDGQSLSPTVLLLGIESSEFILRKWIENLFKEMYAAVVALFECKYLETTHVQMVPSL